MALSASFVGAKLADLNFLDHLSKRCRVSSLLEGSIRMLLIIIIVIMINNSTGMNAVDSSNNIN